MIDLTETDFQLRSLQDVRLWGEVIRALEADAITERELAAIEARRDALVRTIDKVVDRAHARLVIREHRELMR